MELSAGSTMKTNYPGTVSQMSGAQGRPISKMPQEKKTCAVKVNVIFINHK